MAETEDFYDIGIIQLALHFYHHLSNRTGFFQAAVRLPEKAAVIFLFSLILCGVTVTTVYTQFLSLFCKIGALANLLLILLCIAAFIAYPRSFYLQYLKKLKNTFFCWSGLLYIGLILFIAFCTSRGTIHTDTSLYHAQAVRWYEEYGVVKGLGNLQLALCVQQLLFCIRRAV